MTSLRSALHSILRSIAAAIFEAPEVTAAETAQRRLAENNDNILLAEQLLASMKSQRIEDARADAAALEAAIAAANSEAEKAELRRQSELDWVNNQTDARIKALEEAIAAARQFGAERLGRIAQLQAAERIAEQERLETAEAALDELYAAAGYSAK